MLGYLYTATLDTFEVNYEFEEGKSSSTTEVITCSYSGPLSSDICSLGVSLIDIDAFLKLLTELDFIFSIDLAERPYICTPFSSVTMNPPC